VEIRQLEAFIAVAQEGNFTQAADRLDIRQPSLSARIRRLERSLGGKLIDRSSRPVALTPLGKSFLPLAERALAILEAAGELARAEHLDSGMQLRLGCPFSVATYLMPEVVDGFSHEFPQAELYIEAGNSDFVVSRLRDELIDLGFAAAFPKFLTQAQILLQLHDEMAVAVSPENPMAGLRAVPVAELWLYRVLLIHWGPAFQAYVDSLRQMSPIAGPVVRLPLASALPMTRQPNTITFMPRRLIQASGLAEVDIRGFSFAWDIALLTRPGRRLNHLETKFVEIVNTVWQESEPARL
jgi:DNA-binding transcriptional LysR family regulator